MRRRHCPGEQRAEKNTGRPQQPQLRRPDPAGSRSSVKNPDNFGRDIPARRRFLQQQLLGDGSARHIAKAALKFLSSKPRHHSLPSTASSRTLKALTSSAALTARIMSSRPPIRLDPNGHADPHFIWYVPAIATHEQLHNPKRRRWSFIRAPVQKSRCETG